MVACSPTNLKLRKPPIRREEMMGNIWTRMFIAVISGPRGSSIMIKLMNQYQFTCISQFIDKIHSDFCGVL